MGFIFTECLDIGPKCLTVFHIFKPNNDFMFQIIRVMISLALVQQIEVNRIVE